MGKDLKDPPRKVTRLQLERQLIQLHNQANRMADLVDMHYQKIAQLVAGLGSLDQEPDLTESGAGETTKRSRHRATSLPLARNKQGACGPKARK